MLLLSPVAPLQRFVWQDGLSDGWRRKRFREDSGAWNVARCVPRRPCYRGPSVVATRHDCQGSLLEAGAISSVLITHDLRLTCQSFSPPAGEKKNPPTLLLDSPSSGDREKEKDVCTSEAECVIRRYRSEIEKKKTN